MQAPGDKDVIVKIKQGRIDDFSFIVKKYTKQIRNFVWQKLFDKSDVDDLVQNIFLSFYKTINRFDEDRSIKPYLFQIVRNELKMYYRSKKTTVSLTEADQLSFEDKLAPGLEENANYHLLSAEQKKALELLTEEYSYQEIAKIFKRPLNTVKTIIRRARLRLKKAYE